MPVFRLNRILTVLPAEVNKILICVSCTDVPPLSGWGSSRDLDSYRVLSQLKGSIETTSLVSYWNLYESHLLA